MSDDFIKRSDAIKAVAEVLSLNRFASFKDIKDFGRFAERMLRNVPSADRPQGEWIEREVFRSDDNDTSNPIIDDWQSAKCSVCGKYHTTPYLYYFDNFNFCPHCGARMKGAEDDID